MLPLLSVPGLYYQGNAEPAVECAEFVSAAVGELHESHCICMVDDRPHITCMQSIVCGVKQSGQEAISTEFVVSQSVSAEREI